ncbi:MAG: FMN-binding negative transcriptional regulator [Acinetobacter faecalis]|uniref:FMN-binding negative transcriptional regulator n=1 Tax=Acinetobacter faecalis TaxID=2665161 RepID=A0ABU5GL03_9GAMM|nr:FMN-binding negative transcriptional regulator [Acinetobacter faecalis]MDY6490119.1 FMN-binding negative transcriptional regulator [Acinetobacter faecalis]MDY6531166.1 FMN-binding negative transcriptional regulator [Acinetobacter faecalis]MDY6551142.1 FMN-binding negative transcriptional regulator [Acinetobacter faecalis]
MYIPKVFEETRTEVLTELIQKHALGCLILHTNGELDANHLPFEYDEKSHSLYAHIAKENPLYIQLKQSQNVLVVFSIDHAYVSPNWYVGKFEHHKAVPTWNYVVIHAKGMAELIEDEKVLRGILARLTRQHESNQPKPWKMSDAPKDYIQNELSKITAIRIEISSLVGKFKLSQNRDVIDQVNVAEAYKQNSKNTLAEMMLNK